MTSKTTIGTEKLSFIERHLYNSSAFTTGLACISWIDFDKLSTACYCFVGQHLDKAFPRSIAYAFSEPMIIEHTFNVQILNSNKRIRFGEPMAEFMQEVSPLVYNFDVLLCQPESCLSSINRAFLFSTQPSLQEFQSFFSFDDVFRIIYKFSIGQDSIAFKPNIQSNFFRRRMLNGWNFNFTSEYGKPLSSFVLLDGECLDFAFWDSMQNNRHTSNLAKPDSLITQQLEPALRESDAINPALESRKTFFLTGFVFNPAKEIGEGFMYSVRNILFNLGMNFRIFASKIGVIIKFVEGNFAKLISVYRPGKKLIVDCFANLERIKYSDLLLPRRINPEFIHSQFHFICKEVDEIFKFFVFLKPIHPPAKASGIYG